MRALYERFAQTVARYPGLTALEVAGEALSYTCLADRAAHLAALLPTATPGRPLRRIGILANRSVTAYAGYLATLRLGATAVPLGPDWPPERLAVIADEARLDMVLTDGAAPTMPVPTVHVDASAATAGAVPGSAADHAVPRPAQPNDVAYILFTSGTTGTPKGVPILHGNVSALLDYVIPRYGLGPDCRVSQTFDLTFDLSVWDMFSAWSSGATLVVPTRNDLVRPARFIARQRLTHWFSVPSLIDYADRLRDLSPGRLPELRWSGFCGEQLTLAQARLWQSAAPRSVLENLYGPTELTVVCMEYRLPRDPAHWPRTSNGTVPIGTPYPHLEALVLDGELCVRGPQRFPGYVRPADNAGRFVRPGRAVHETHDPPGPDFFYRTGDRVGPVSEVDPELVHLGRIDQQVKIGGHRIEPAEVEAALRALPGITQAVVVARRGHVQELGLQAYYTGQPQDQMALRAGLSGLPRYMVPSGFTHLDSLPVNPNGKVDRLALSDLCRSGGAAAATGE
ncbi:MAG TPA: AMP-binding protein [Streptosporangiaceae bacterium]|nr:AMP-binding protein [Streptosporangiaceae bacterium]